MAFNMAASRRILVLCTRNGYPRTPSGTPGTAVVATERRHKGHSLTSVERGVVRTYATSSGSGRRSGQASLSITFEEYRKTRRALKVRARVSGIPLAFVGMATSSAAHLHYNPRLLEMTPEEVQPIFGMDPIMFAALCGAGSGVVGFALGGAIFNAVWRLVMRNTARQIDEWETNFLSRLQKHRFSELNKYEDDYYGEKVMTLSDYRQWVRQQHRKRERVAKAQNSQLGEGEKLQAS